MASSEELAGLLYNAAKVDQARTGIKPEAPPVFIMDAHRGDNRDGRTDNSHTYQSTDLPSAEELKANGITKVVYLNEADYEGKVVREDAERVQEDIRPAIGEWSKNGIKLFRTGIYPYPEQKERTLSYPDKPPEIFADGEGIAMHHDRHRYILGRDGKLSVISEFGIARGLSDDEVIYFKSRVEHQLAEQPDNKQLEQAFSRFPQDTTE